MRPIWIFRHAATEGPGYLASVLGQRELPFKVIGVDRGDAVPEHPDAAAALVFMGGPMSVNDPLPWIGQELALIRRARAIGIPLLGHCLGAQLISKALGGTVTRNPLPEIGWLPVRRSTAPDAPVWLTALPTEFEVFHWHGETYSLPPGATRILDSAHCPQQGFVLDHCLALQCHIEMTAELVQTWARDGQRELAAPTATVQSAETMRTDLTQRVARLHGIADAFYGPWLAAVQQRA